MAIRSLAANVIIDGVKYTPDTQKRSTYGVAVSTHNRPEVLKETLPKLCQRTPEDIPIIVVADNKQTWMDAKTICPDRVKLLKSDPGVYNSKNKALEYFCITHPVEHIFLLDDDIYPLQDGWAELYIDAPEDHYAHSFALLETYRDNDIVATTRAGGTLLYYTRDCISKVGGMSGEFGTWGCEHVNMSDRIHNLGLTSFRYQDIADAYDGSIFYELDRKENTRRNFRSSKSPQQAENNKRMYSKYEELRPTDTRFIEYRHTVPLKYVVTVYCSGSNPQGGEFELTADKLEPLIDSLPDDYQLIVVSDMNFEDNRFELLQVEPSDIPMDYQRWHLLRYALDHISQRINGLRGVEAWHVDATDVVMLHHPHPEPGTLYIGDEPTTVGCKWMMNQLDKLPNREEYEPLHNEPLLNGGIVGGDAETLRLFTNRMSDEMDKITYWSNANIIRDMLPLQLAARSMNYKHGPLVNSVFKGTEGRETAWWAHKLAQ